MPSQLPSVRSGFSCRPKKDMPIYGLELRRYAISLMKFELQRRDPVNNVNVNAHEVLGYGKYKYKALTILGRR